MGQAGIHVGIDVAKAKVDVAVRPTGERWEVPRDAAGIPQLVSELKTLGPSSDRHWCCWRLRAAWNYRWWLLGPPRRCRWSSSTRARCGTSPGLLGSRPRPPPGTPPCWPTLLRRSSPPCVLCATPKPRSSTR